MAVRRIVFDVATSSVAEVRQFYSDLFDLEPIMDQGWIVTLASEHSSRVQVSIASEGGSGTPVPDVSIEVDDVDDVYQKARSMGGNIEYELTNEPWGVRRFFLRDPAGKLLNILSHNR